MAVSMNEKTKYPPRTVNLIQLIPGQRIMIWTVQILELAKPALSVTFRSLSACPRLHILAQQIGEEKADTSTRKMYFPSQRRPSWELNPPDATVSGDTISAGLLNVNSGEKPARVW